MELKKLQDIIVDALDDIKGRDIAVFDTTKGSAEFDRVIIATADVARQTKAMAMNVIDKVKAAGGRIVSMEGGDSGEWVLVDCSDVIVHIMQPAVRLHYNLEELWGQKKVKVTTPSEKAAEKAAQAAAVARYGLKGLAAVASATGFNMAEAATNTAIAQFLTASERAKYGDDISWQAQISDIAMAAAVGGIITPIIHGAIGAVGAAKAAFIAPRPAMPAPERI